jgi:hypothetical protein
VLDFKSLRGETRESWMEDNRCSHSIYEKPQITLLRTMEPVEHIVDLESGFKIQM